MSVHEHGHTPWNTIISTLLPREKREKQEGKRERGREKYEKSLRVIKDMGQIQCHEHMKTDEARTQAEGDQRLVLKV